MPHARFIKNNMEKHMCNICAEEIESDKIVSLICNPVKHIFCYDCIFDWYNQLKNKPNINNYGIYRMCPICRDNGGYLPLYGTKYIRGIHGTKISQIIEYKTCSYKLKNNDLCKNKGFDKYGGFCNNHKILLKDKEKNCNDNGNSSLFSEVSTKENTENTENNYNDNENLSLFSGTKVKENAENIELNQNNLCGANLKSKKSLCKKKGNILFGGCCHLHKKIVI
jgi:hypothetical protein